MPKLAIYVPKKNMREIEKWRKRLNFSKIFMSALESEIRNRSRAVQVPPDKLTAAAAYYRAQLADSSSQLVDFGYQLGATHVMGCRLPASTIGQLMAIADIDNASDTELQLLDSVLSAEEDSLENFCAKNGYDEQSHPMRRQAIYAGFLKGVRDTWEKVCQHMKTGPRRESNVS